MTSLRESTDIDASRIDREVGDDLLSPAHPFVRNTNDNRFMARQFFSATASIPIHEHTTSFLRRVSILLNNRLVFPQRNIVTRYAKA